ncbi:MAG: response regulator, partial [Clostridia bacterium]|nr:response regulator [Clostridia bacterium]
PLCREKNISLSIEKGNADVAILIDKVRFNQMCFNLLSNAVKYTPAGGHVKMKMVHGAISQGKLPCDIYISDDGIGIKPEFLPHIYEPFSQEGRAFQSIEGTGLGLSIVKEIVDLLQGTIDVETEVGKGTTFHIHLDMTLAAPSKLTDQAEMYDMKLLSGKTVLLAEDHPMNQEITKRLLDKVEMNVVIADNGQKAVTEFENNSHRYDAILMDMRMPVMDGLQAARAIRALTIQKAKEIPIIAMTANAFEEDRKDSAAAGMNAHLAKPVDPDTLYHVLSQCIKDSLDHTL